MVLVSPLEFQERSQHVLNYDQICQDTKVCNQVFVIWNFLQVLLHCAKHQFWACFLFFILSLGSYSMSTIILFLFVWAFLRNLKRNIQDNVDSKLNHSCELLNLQSYEKTKSGLCVRENFHTYKMTKYWGLDNTKDGPSEQNANR